jgi:hypothetical protein
MRPTFPKHISFPEFMIVCVCVCVCLYINRSVLQLRPWTLSHLCSEVPLFTSSCTNHFKFTQCRQWTSQFVALLKCYCWSIYFEQWEIYLQKMKLHVGTVKFPPSYFRSLDKYWRYKCNSCQLGTDWIIYLYFLFHKLTWTHENSHFLP